MKTTYEGDITYRKAKEVLMGNAMPEGNPIGLIAGDRESYRNNVWGRDGLISCLAMSNSGDEDLIYLAEKTIDTLAEKQYKVPVDGSEPSFGKAGCVDASLWYPVALWNHYKNTGIASFLERNRRRAEEAIKWANSLDQNNDYLIEANARSDWLDLYGRPGRVLYNQILNFMALKSLYNIQEEMSEPKVINWPLGPEELHERIEMVRKNIQRFLWPKEDYIEDIEKEYGYNHSWIHQDFRKALAEKKELEKRGEEYFLAAVDFDRVDWRFDTIANTLAILSGIADEEQTSHIIDYMKNHRILEPYPAKSLNPPVTPEDPEYRLIFPDSDFEYSDEPGLHKERTTPGNYHNGGIWPWVGGYAVLAEERAGEDVSEDIDSLGRLNSIYDYGFIEWINSRGDAEGPRGTTRQSWSAANYMLLHQKISGKNTVFDDLM